MVVAGGEVRGTMGEAAGGQAQWRGAARCSGPWREAGSYGPECLMENTVIV